MHHNKPQITIHTKIPDVMPTKGLHYFVPLKEPNGSDIDILTKNITSSLESGFAVDHCYRLFADNLYRVTEAQLDHLLSNNINVFDMHPHFTRLSGHFTADRARADVLYCVKETLVQAFAAVKGRAFSDFGWVMPFKDAMDAQLKKLQISHDHCMHDFLNDASVSAFIGNSQETRIGFRVPASAFGPQKGVTEVPIEYIQGVFYVRFTLEQTQTLTDVFGDLNVL